MNVSAPMYREKYIRDSQVEGDTARRTADWNRLREIKEAANRRDMLEAANRKGLREKWEAANRKSEREMREAANTLISLGQLPPARAIGEIQAVDNTQEVAQTLIETSKNPPAAPSTSKNQPTPNDPETMERTTTMLMTMNQNPGTSETDIVMDDSTQDAAPAVSKTHQDEQRESQIGPNPIATTDNDRRQNPRRNARKAPKYNFKTTRRPRKIQPKAPPSTARPPPFLAATRAEEAARMEAERIEIARTEAAGMKVGCIAIDLTSRNEMEVDVTERKAPARASGLMARHLCRGESFRAAWRGDIAREEAARTTLPPFQAARERVRMLWQ